MLAKKTPFTPAEEAAVTKHLDDYPEIEPLYMPSDPGQNPFSNLIASNDPYAFARSYAYNVAPVTDNAPFFFFTLKAGQILGEKGLRGGIDWKVNLGVLVLLLVLVISLVAVLGISDSSAGMEKRERPPVAASASSISWPWAWATSWWRSLSSSASCCFSAIPPTR